MNYIGNKTGDKNKMSDWKDWDYMFEKGKGKIDKPLTFFN